jgi:ADP-ribose pyrophosphatase YjhB (NUDIX family)
MGKEKEKRIRVVALGIIQEGDRLFLSRGKDPATQQVFYRSLGGGVKFGEPSEQALKREFQEEINADIINIKYLGTIENIFTFNQVTKHEIAQIFQCDFADRKFYELDQVNFQEKNRQKVALWLPKSLFISNELRLVPANVLSLLPC